MRDAMQFKTDQDFMLHFIKSVISLPWTPIGKLEVFKFQKTWAKGEREAVKEYGYWKK